MGEMKEAGIVAVSDDGRPVPTAGMMRRAMEYARGFGLTVIDHCEDRSLVKGGVMHEGLVSLKLGLRGMPAAGEEIDALRDCMLAELTGASVHLAHVSTRGAIEAVRRAKEKGLKVTCEAAPHHFALTDDAVEGYDTNYKVSPPLRSADHVQAVFQGLKDGTIDAIATDHAPHHQDEKELEFDLAPFGVTGLESGVGLVLDKLVNGGVISLVRMVELCSTNPAKILGLDRRGTLKIGSWGDVTIFDPTRQWIYTTNESQSKSRNTPFNGWTLQGSVVATVVKGKIVFQRTLST